MPPARSEPRADALPPGIRAGRKTAALVAHADSPRLGVNAIDVTVALEPDGTLALEYALSGSLDGLHIPTVGPVGPGERLWEHTCFEVFIRADGAPGYVEFNFAPSRQWAALGFAGYRKPGASRHRPAPAVEVLRQGGLLSLSVRVPAAALPELRGARRVRFAVSAVIESRAGELAYWALWHPAGRPDFHHAEAFAIAIDAGLAGGAR
jgi:hypothetical protein